MRKSKGSNASPAEPPNKRRKTAHQVTPDGKLGSTKAASAATDWSPPSSSPDAKQISKEEHLVNGISVNGKSKQEKSKSASASLNATPQGAEKATPRSATATDPTGKNADSVTGSKKKNATGKRGWVGWVEVVETEPESKATTEYDGEQNGQEAETAGDAGRSLRSTRIPSHRSEAAAQSGGSNVPSSAKRKEKPAKAAKVDHAEAETVTNDQIESKTGSVTQQKGTSEKPETAKAGPRSTRKSYPGYAFVGEEELGQPKLTKFERFEKEAREEVDRQLQEKDEGVRPRRERKSTVRDDTLEAPEALPRQRAVKEKRSSKDKARKVAKPVEQKTVAPSEELDDKSSEVDLLQTNGVVGEDGLHHLDLDLPLISARDQDDEIGESDIAAAETYEEPAAATAEPMPAADEEWNESASALELRRLLTSNPQYIEMIKARILATLTRRDPIVNYAEYAKVRQLLSQTVLAGQGNSMLVIGARGIGKTAMINRAIADLQAEFSDDFYVVRLNGFLHADNRIALKEIWRQLGKAMDVDDELSSGRSNFADILSSLLTLLSYQATSDGEAPLTTSKSVVFVLDEFDRFAAQPRQTLLYNLFDLVQSSPTPMAVLGVTTKANVVEEMLEKRVKSRFSQRRVILTAPRSLDEFKDVCRRGVEFHVDADAQAKSFSDRIIAANTSSLSDDNRTLKTVAELWNAYIADLLEHPSVAAHLSQIYSTTRKPVTFHTNCLLPIASLTPSGPLPHPAQLSTSTSTLNLNLSPPDLQSSTAFTSLLPSLSSLALALLIAAARLEIILLSTASSTPSSASGITIQAVTFDLSYNEYINLSRKSLAHGPSSSVKVYTKGIARGEWQRLVRLGLLLPAGTSVGASSTGASTEGKRGRGRPRKLEATGAPGSGSGVKGVGNGGGGGMWYCDLALEEIGSWLAAAGNAAGRLKVMGRWCRQI